MPSRDVPQSSPRGRVVPPCLLCHGTLGVRPLMRQPEGVKYWACDDCRVAWASRNAEDPRSIEADQSPRKSA